MAINKRCDKYVLDWWAEGKRYRKFFDTKREAEAHQTEVKKKKLDGTYVAPDRVPLFKEAAEAWLTTRTDRAESTYESYAIRVRRHLIRRFGDKRLNEITTDSIARWRSALTQDGGNSKWHRAMAPSRIRGLLGTLSAIFDSAVRNGRCASNPVDRLERAYNRATEGKREDSAIRPDEILSSDEIRRLLDASKAGLYRTLFTLAADTGAREGELLALKWSDIAFDGKPHISIRRSLSWAKGPLDNKRVAHFGPPKTKAGTRDIAIGGPVVVALKAWKLKAGRNEMDLVFAEDRSPLERSNMLRYGFQPALKEAKLRGVKFHSLRHSYASGLIMHGATITEVAQKMGHANPTITLNTYSHWFKGADSGAAAAYSTSIFGANV